MRIMIAIHLSCGIVIDMCRISGLIEQVKLIEHPAPNPFLQVTMKLTK